MRELRFFVEDFLNKQFQYQEIVGVEIGVEGGTLSSYLLSHCKNIKRLYCIDPWKHYPNSSFDGHKPQKTHDYHYERFLALTEDYKDRRVILKMTSDEAIKNINEKADFVFIDGEHSYNFVRNDILNYSPIVKSGGWIGGHDYGIVKKAVEEIYPDRILDECGTWWKQL